MELKFKKVSSRPSSYDAGTVYFNDATHSILVAKTTTTADEYGGRIKDVTYEDGVLTITKYTEDASGTVTYALDFTDVASTTDVTKVLSGLYDRVGSVEKSVSTNAGNIATNTQNIAANTKAIKALQDTLGTGDESLASRVTAAEGEIDDLQTTVGQHTTQISNKANISGSSAQTFAVATPGNASDATPKSYVDDKISEAVSSTYKVKGSVADKTALSNLTNLSNGDVYNVTAEVTIDATDVATKKFITAGTYPAGSNWVWIEHENNDPHPSHWDAIGGMITGYATDEQITTVVGRVAKLENGENTVKTFGGQSGIINIKTVEATDANGTVQFTVEKTSTSNNVVTSKLTATVKGLAGAAYKNVSETSTNVANPIGNTNYKNNNYIPTNSAVAAAIAAEHSTITNEIKNNSTMTWAEWPTS